MKQSPYYFEIKDILTQFVAAFDDIVIKRYNEKRQIEDRIQVRYVYSPKQRVLYDLINLAKTITIPAVAVSIKSISRDETRVFNKIDGFYYKGVAGVQTAAAHLKPPVPINIEVDVSIIARYQTDMDQILSNFVPYSNPYIVIGWKVPSAFGLPQEQEIRSEVLWSGNIAMNYPVETTGDEKARITADTSFTIKGWLFKEQVNPVGNIYYIDTNFSVESLLTTYEDLSSTVTYPVSTGLYNETESFELSGSPTITNVFLNNVQLFSPGTVYLNTSASVILEGYSFNHLQGILLSASNDRTYTQTTTSVNNFKRQPETIIGMPLNNYVVINDNIVSITTPPLKKTCRFILVPFNRAGYATSNYVLETPTLSGNGTFINVI